MLAATRTLNTTSINTMMNAPTTMPLLFAVPPITKAAHTRKVDFAGLMKGAPIQLDQQALKDKRVK